MRNTNKTPLLKVFRSKVNVKNNTSPEHHHTALEVTVILSGKGTYATREREYSFQKNDVFFYSTDELHQIKEVVCDAEFINLHFEPRYLWSESLGIASKELTKTFLNPPKTSDNKIPHNTYAADTIRELLFKTEQEISEQKPEFETMLTVYLVNILIEILRCRGDKLHSSDISANSHTLKAMENALNYIDTHLDSELSLKTLADTAHMSKTYFCSKFKQLNGISPWDYITIKRIEKAIYYIESTNMTRLEIALKCGYNNTSNFYYAFKKITGKSPGDYAIS